MNVGEYRVSVPVGSCGVWEVEKFKVSDLEASIHNLRIMESALDREIGEGSYTALTRDDKGRKTTVMSDTPAEVRDHVAFIQQAKGRVLIAGLGLGVVLQGLLKNPMVSHVDVVELSEDVISLVAPHYENLYPGKFTIHNKSIYTAKWDDDQKWGAAWFDVWDHISPANIFYMNNLVSKYHTRAALVGCWAIEHCWTALEDEMTLLKELGGSEEQVNEWRAKVLGGETT